MPIPSMRSRSSSSMATEVQKDPSLEHIKNKMEEFEMI